MQLPQVGERVTNGIGQSGIVTHTAYVEGFYYVGAVQPGGREEALFQLHPEMGFEDASRFSNPPILDDLSLTDERGYVWPSITFLVESTDHYLPWEKHLAKSVARTKARREELDKAERQAYNPT